jgi:acyl-CoA synthetase (AMP-forming)/AMP-acid ligase II
MRDAATADNDPVGAELGIANSRVAPSSIIANLDTARREFRDRVLLNAPEGTVTYGEFAELVEGAAAWLTEQGLRPGDRLAVAAGNGLDAAVAIWACARGGFVYVGLPTNLRAPQWAFMLRHSAAVLALGQPNLVPTLADAAAQANLPSGRAIPLVDHLTGRRLSWRTDGPMPDPDATYAVVYTSGTTGHPKAARVCHRMTMHAAGFYQHALGLRPSDRTAIHLPFYYVSGHITQLNPIMAAGGSAIVMPEFSAAELVRLIRDEGVTVLDVVPAIFARLLLEPGFALPGCAGLRVAAYGGAPMPAATLAAITARLPGLQLCEVYGMSETAGVISAVTDQRHQPATGSVGYPIPGVQVRIVDESGADVPAGESGEIWVAGPVVTPGYLGDAAATAAAITDGWLHTGDNGRINSDGSLTVLDRKKDMIIRGGVKIYPAQVEALLLEHPSVADAAVIGAADPLAGERVVAFLVAADESRIDRTAIRRWVGSRLATHAVPARILLVDRLPRVPTGKVDKAALRRQLTAESESMTKDHTDDGNQ